MEVLCFPKSKKKKYLQYFRLLLQGKLHEVALTVRRTIQITQVYLPYAPTGAMRIDDDDDLRVNEAVSLDNKTALLKQ